MPELADNQDARLEQLLSGLSFPLSSPTSALCSDQKRKLQLKGRKCKERKDLDLSWCASPGAAFTGHLVLLVPQGTKSHLAYIPGCTVMPCGWGWRHSGGPDRPSCHQCVQELRNTYLPCGVVGPAWRPGGVEEGHWLIP